MRSKRGRNGLVPGGGSLFQRMFTRLGCDGRPPRFRVEFYPYASLVLTIRRREEVVYVRFSDLLRRAPPAVLEGAAALLLARVYRRKASGALTEAYLEYARSDRTRSRMNQMRRGRVRLAATNPRGDHFDLDRLFDELNGKYFEGQLVAAPAYRMEHAELAAAIRLLRSRAESDSAESPDGSSGGSSVRGGICIVSRDAAREAPDSPLGLQHGVSFAGISRGREAF